MKGLSALVLLVGVAFAGYYFYDTPVTAAQPAAATLAKDGLQIGDKAPDFKLENTDGLMYGLADIKAADGSAPKGYIVVFTCNTCPYAVAYEDRLVELHNKMAPMGYPVVAIMPNDTEIKPDDNMAAMQMRAKEKAFNFVYLLDAKQSVYPQYGATRTPEIYLLDSEYILRYTGAIDDNFEDAAAVQKRYVEDAVAALEAGKAPEPAVTKAVGCTIKVKKQAKQTKQ